MSSTLSFIRSARRIFSRWSWFDVPEPSCVSVIEMPFLSISSIVNWIPAWMSFHGALPRLRLAGSS